MIVKTLLNLNKWRFKAMTKRYFNGKQVFTVLDMAKELGVTEKRIQQVANKLLKRNLKENKDTYLLSGDNVKVFRSQIKDLYNNVEQVNRLRVFTKRGYEIVVGYIKDREESRKEYKDAEKGKSFMKTSLPRFTEKIELKKTIMSSELYRFLGLDVGNYAKWKRKNIEQNLYAKEGRDYKRYVIEYDRRGFPRRIEYELTLDFAKKLIMLSRSYKGEVVRTRYLNIEKLFYQYRKRLSR